MKAEILQLTREQYDALEGVNFSTLKHLKRSPAHYHAELLKTKLQKDDEDTDARRLGRVTHVAMIEPERFASMVAVWDGGRRAGKEWETFKAQHKGKELITLEQYNQAIAMSRAVRSNEKLAYYLRKGKAELTIRWECEGVVCKSRIDFVSGVMVPNTLVDIKTAQDASPRAFGRAAWDFDYVMQAAMYSDAYHAATGDRLRYLLGAVEKSPPYVAAPYWVAEELIDYGRNQYRELLVKLKTCREQNNWHGYAEDDEVLALQLPPWAIPADEGEGVEDLGLIIGGAANG